MTILPEDVSLGIVFFIVLICVLSVVAGVLTMRGSYDKQTPKRNPHTPRINRLN